MYGFFSLHFILNINTFLSEDILYWYKRKYVTISFFFSLLNIDSYVNIYSICVMYGIDHGFNIYFVHKKNWCDVCKREVMSSNNILTYKWRKVSAHEKWQWFIFSVTIFDLPSVSGT